jgi:hypothetical protein
MPVRLKHRATGVYLQSTEGRYVCSTRDQEVRQAGPAPVATP